MHDDTLIYNVLALQRWDVYIDQIKLPGETIAREWWSNLQWEEDLVERLLNTMILYVGKCSDRDWSCLINITFISILSHSRSLTAIFSIRNCPLLSPLMLHSASFFQLLKHPHPWLINNNKNEYNIFLFSEEYITYFKHRHEWKQIEWHQVDLYSHQGCNWWLILELFNCKYIL